MAKLAQNAVTTLNVPQREIKTPTRYRYMQRIYLRRRRRGDRERLRLKKKIEQILKEYFAIMSSQQWNSSLQRKFKPDDK